jgi:hypothetical protein
MAKSLYPGDYRSGIVRASQEIKILITAGLVYRAPNYQNLTRCQAKQAAKKHPERVNPASSKRPGSRRLCKYKFLEEAFFELWQADFSQYVISQYRENVPSNVVAPWRPSKEQAMAVIQEAFSCPEFRAYLLGGLLLDNDITLRSVMREKTEAFINASELYLREIVSHPPECYQEAVDGERKRGIERLYTQIRQVKELLFYPETIAAMGRGLISAGLVQLGGVEIKPRA